MKKDLADDIINAEEKPLKDVGIVAEKKEKRYVSDDARLMAEWNWEKNTDISPTQLTVGSHKKVWWKCNKGHEWQATFAHRNIGRGCPYCSGCYAIKGENDLHTLNPKLSEEWNFEKNGELTPMDVLPNSHKKVWWICSKRHEWQASIKDRNNGNGCPYCSGRRVVKGETDLQTVNPDLAREWDFEKNDGLTPIDLSCYSDKKVWWKCGKGHEYQATISNRTIGRGCPYCSNRMVLQGYNDLQTINPILASEWNYEKNDELTPTKVVSNSNKKVWWKCKKEHEWMATIRDRNYGTGCPICQSERRTSFPEYAIIFYLEKYGVKTIHLCKEYGYELDVYIPTKKIAIEYDGYFWHKERGKEDCIKNQRCLEDGITLYRIREGLPTLNDSSIDYIVDGGLKDLSSTLKELFYVILGINIDVNLERDSIDIEGLREFIEKKNSLLSINTAIAAEWNYEKNGKLKPEFVTVNSKKKVWWKCSNGHEWQATIVNRNYGNGCPYCAGIYVIDGENDLQTINATLSNEWNYHKNGELTPRKVKPNSNKKVWWICSKGHEWQAKIQNRNNGSGCPECAKLKRKSPESAK